MPECRVLVIEADASRAENLRAILEFVDFRAGLVASADEVPLADHRPQDWLAIIVGDTSSESLDRFVAWLRRDRRHPPLIVLQAQHETLMQRYGLDPSACLSLDMPVRYGQLSEHLKRASLLNMERDVAALPSSGPTGNSAGMRRVRKLSDPVAGFDTTVQKGRASCGEKV